MKTGVVADVYRVQPLSVNGAAPAAPLVVKIINPDAETGPDGRDREANFYAAVHPLLGFERPLVFFAGCDPETRERIVVMEALQGYRNPPRTHRWTPEEARCFIRTYARMHAARPPGQNAAPWLFCIRPREFTAENTLEPAAELVRTGAWAPLPDLERLLGWVAAAGADFENLPESYLHGDVFPPNISLPDDLSGEAVLIDWDMAGTGLAEMDLAFMFLQPFGSAADLDREQVLADYWRERGRLDGAVPSPEERRIRQRYADALWGLYLIRVAHKSVFDPFPAGSPADRYWDAMRLVLHRWLERMGK